MDSTRLINLSFIFCLLLNCSPTVKGQSKQINNELNVKDYYAGPYIPKPNIDLDKDYYVLVFKDEVPEYGSDGTYVHYQTRDTLVPFGQYYFLFTDTLQSYAILYCHRF